MSETAEVSNQTNTPSASRAAEMVRRNLKLTEADVITVSEESEFSNINYVFRAKVSGRSLYLKVVPPRPRNFPVNVPPERVLSEARGLVHFRALAAGGVVIPQVLFVDKQEMALGMSDVGSGRQVLFSILAQRFDLFAAQSHALGRSLGAIHGGTRDRIDFRPPQEDFIIRKIIFDGLLGPGAQTVFPESWAKINAEMQAKRECLVHGDLWSKNLLVKEGEPIAIVDFEGVHYGDPAFDLATLAAVALLPALEDNRLVTASLSFIAQLLDSWSSACGSPEWAEEVNRRVFRGTATFLAARGFGPFAYSMSDVARERVAFLAKSLVEEPPSSSGQFESRVKEAAFHSTAVEA